MVAAGVQAVLFDAVGTVIYPDPPVAVAYHTIARRHGSRLTVAEIEQRFQQAFGRGMSSVAGDLRTDAASERRRWQQIVAEVFCELPQGTAALFHALWDYFARPASWQVYADFPPVCERLLRQHYQVGLASNFDQRLEAICRSLYPLNQLTHIFHSAELGHCKPARAFFRAVESQLELPPDQILLVGDDLVADQQGALQAGWHSLRIDRRGRRQQGVLTDLRQLLDELDGA